MSNPSPSRRVCLIALDAADLPTITAGGARLPHLQRLLGESVTCRLDGPGDTLSASVWPTFYTGTDPGEHGHYYPMQWDAATMSLRRVTASWPEAIPFWYPLSEAGVPVLALDVQVQQQLGLANGVEVSNWGSQSFSHWRCSTPELKREIRRRFGTHPMGPDVPVAKSRRRIHAMAADLRTGIARRGALARWLLAGNDWRLAILVFPELHRAGHYLVPDPHDGPRGEASAAWKADLLFDQYRAVDTEIGRILEEASRPDTTFVFFSLHGMGPNTTQVHMLPAVVDRFNDIWGRPATNGHATPPAAKGLLRRLREQVPDRVQETLALSVPENLRDWVTTRVFAGHLDGSSTPAFAVPSGTEGAIRLNVAGREPHGILSDQDGSRRAYTEDLTAALEELHDADTDRPLVAEVHQPQTLYPGPRADLLPDLAVRWTDAPPAARVRSPRLGLIDGALRHGRSGNHTGDAFAIVHGAPSATLEPFLPHHIRDLRRLVEGLLAISPRPASPGPLARSVESPREGVAPAGVVD